MRQLRVNAINEVQAEDVLQAAHDICSPLTALKVLLARAEQMPIGDLKDMLRVTAVRIEQVAESLLAGARQVSRLPLKDWFAHKKMELDKGVEFRLLADPCLRFDYLVDAGLGRVLSNLVNNSIQAGASRVTLHVWRSGKEMAFAVSDDGRGFPTAVLEALEDGRSVSVGKTGNGLGLSHAQAYVGRLGGQFQVMATGLGTTIVLVRIPV